jgi:hypothetical protein
MFRYHACCVRCICIYMYIHFDNIPFYAQCAQLLFFLSLSEVPCTGLCKQSSNHIYKHCSIAMLDNFSGIIRNAKCKIGSLESSFNWSSAYTLLCSVPSRIVNNRRRTYIWIYFPRWKMYKKLRWIIFCSSDATSIEKKIKKEILLWNFSKIMFTTQMVQGPLQKKSKTKRRETHFSFIVPDNLSAIRVTFSFSFQIIY